MVYLLVTIDTESQKVRVENRLRHVDYVGSIVEQVHLLLDLGDRFGLKYTFFLPLGELLPDYPEVVDLLEQILSRGHDVQAHRHLPFPKATEAQIVEWLGDEVRLFERYAGYRPIAIRAGGYAVGRGGKWINAILTCGFRIDSSVWAGANTETTILIRDEQKAIEEEWWGPGALEFDFRGAPIGGAYFCQLDNLAAIGDSPLLEIPISLRDYDEVNPWQYKFDPQWQDGATLVRMFRSMVAAENAGGDLYLNMSWHSGQARFWDSRVRRSIPWGDQLHYPLPHLRSFMHFARNWYSSEFADKVQPICLRDVNPEEIQPCVLWGRHQAEYWIGQPGVRGRSNAVGWQEIAASMLCPTCRKGALQVGSNVLVCPECGQGYPVVQNIPILLSIPYIPGEVKTNAIPPVSKPIRRTLWLRVISQQPIRDVVEALGAAARWVGEVIKSAGYISLVLFFAPYALWRVLRGHCRRRPGSLVVPPQQICKIVESMRASHDQ